MESLDLLLGLFFSSENNIVYDNIELSTKLPEGNIHQIKLLPMRFLGPLFMTLAYDDKKKWNINFIESTLSSNQEYKTKESFMQSFLCLNSSVEIENNMTYLFAFIGSPYAEDPKILYEKMNKYVHQSIIQGKYVNQKVYGVDFNYNIFVIGELQRGLNLIKHSLGSPRKMYWEEKKKYYSIGLIERKKDGDVVESNLYTFDTDDPLRTKFLNDIPSYYLMAILPDYFEIRILETLKLFEKKDIYPNIRTIKLSCSNVEVLYIEEFVVKNQIRRSYGLILVPTHEELEDCYEISFFKKKLRLILDEKRDFEKTVIEINSRINPFDKWSANSNEGLGNIKELLDNKN
ncbi:MAG: hypothetical protein JSV23_05690 [Promethearchaeota archaeon]|nr:MAG: hypothetical protein JSV23_05690 [Candidatus Lokiarchaeota archaeon]